VWHRTLTSIYCRGYEWAQLSLYFTYSPSGQVEGQPFLLPHIPLTSWTPPHTTIQHLQLSLTNSKVHYWLINNTEIHTSNLVAKRIGTRVAETEMPARQNQCISYITHAYHTFWPIVFCIIIACSLKKEYNSADMIYHTPSFDSKVYDIGQLCGGWIVPKPTTGHFYVPLSPTAIIRIFLPKIPISVLPSHVILSFSGDYFLAHAHLCTVPIYLHHPSLQPHLKQIINFFFILFSGQPSCSSFTICYILV